MEGYFQVGYVRKKHGFKGDVVVRITADDPALTTMLMPSSWRIKEKPFPYLLKQAVA